MIFRIVSKYKNFLFLFVWVFVVFNCFVIEFKRDFVALSLFLICCNFLVKEEIFVLV